VERTEASGRTVDDALNKALAQLGANRDEVEFVVLDEGKQGGLLSFGRGRDAVVRVERKTSSGRGGRGGRSQRSDRGGSGRDGGRSQGDRSSSGGRSSGRSGFEQSGPELTESDFFGEGESPRRQEKRRERSSGGGRSDGGGRGRARGRDRDDGGGRRPRSDHREPRRTDVEPDINAEEVEFAAGIVDDLLRILDIDADISIREPVTPGDGLGMARAVLDISGDDLGFLIGRRGESLMSFQYVVNLVMTRQYPNQGSITIDIEHYRHRREEKVTSLAERMAERVRETGMSITLEPMTPAERRLVHLSLAEDQELETSSVGEGENRKVVISISER
jgi:spoIIIJ-associated protein